jgi:hypothetical protein
MVRPWVRLHVACADVLGYAAVARRRGVCDGARDRKTGKRWHARGGEGSGTCKRLATAGRAVALCGQRSNTGTQGPRAHKARLRPWLYSQAPHRGDDTVLT